LRYQWAVEEKAGLVVKKSGRLNARERIGIILWKEKSFHESGMFNTFHAPEDPRSTQQTGKWLVSARSMADAAVFQMDFTVKGRIQSRSNSNKMEAC